MKKKAAKFALYILCWTVFSLLAAHTTPVKDYLDGNLGSNNEIGTYLCSVTGNAPIDSFMKVIFLPIIVFAIIFIIDFAFTHDAKKAGTTYSVYTLLLGVGGILASLAGIVFSAEGDWKVAFFVLLWVSAAFTKSVMYFDSLFESEVETKRVVPNIN